ncbi:MAG TPA: winged helix-turn-helix domain-containing protein [Steroidobacter sp.]|uniref:ATP-binding protein n=1 Tax=Steroidobacter sp. TaxID=1978227 RepID=UPI002ED9AEC2
MQITFGPFSLIPGERLLKKDGVAVEIGGRSLELLMVLVEQPGRVVLKHELLKRVWPGVVVEEGSLRFHMASLRKILGDGEDGARYIATQTGVGYAFVAPVVKVSPSHTPRRSAAPTTVGSLPVRPARVIGRKHEIETLSDRITGTQLFTIVGPAGVGKTTLAVEIAHASSSHFADGTSFVDLATLQDPALIPSAIAGVLGIPVQGADPLTVILNHIRSRQLLLVLDNCEHLIEAVANIVEQIKDAAPKTSILATSRETLRVRGEHVHWLNPLDYPGDATGMSLDELLSYPAVELFIERASAGNSALTVDSEAARMIADMCRRLDGMALPIELTAGRVATHGLRATSKLLGEWFSLGWTGRRTAVPRQQTLQATLDWSYDLLSESQRRTFERLSVFLGPFTFDAALHVVSDDLVTTETAVACLDELTAKSLIVPDRSGDGSSYRLLEMTRAYAKKLLLARGSDEHQAVARRHADFFTEVLDAIHLADMNLEQEAPLFSHMLGNIRSALEWSFGPEGDALLAVRLAAVSTRAFNALSLLVECRTWCERALRQLDERHVGTVTELELQTAHGLSMMFTRGNTEAVDAALRRALEIATALDDHWSRLRLLGRLHIFHERIGDFESARAWAETAIRVADVIGEPEATAIAASLAGISHHLAGDQTRARRDLELSLRRSLPSLRGRTICYGFDHRNRSTIALARTLWLQGYADQAKRVAEQAVQEASGLDHPITHCIALIWSHSVHLWRGDLPHAQAGLETFSNYAEVNAFGPYIAASDGFRGQLSIQRGEPDNALDLIEDSLTRLHAARYDLLTSTFEIARAEGLILLGRYQEAIERVSATIERCRANGELYQLPELLRAKANALRCIGPDHADEAERDLQEALECSRNQGARGWELRAAMDLARLWKDRDRVADATGLLRSVRESFTEGFDTEDLRAADRLLQTLSARH